MRSIEIDLFFYLPYMLFLLIILVLAILYQRGDRNLKYISQFLIIITLSLFIGLKPPFSADLKNYCGMFKAINDGYPVLIEPFYIISSKILGLIWDNCLAIFLWYSFLTVCFFHLIIKNYSVNYALSFFILFCLPFLFLNAFGVEIRQVLALVIFTYGALQLIYKNKIKSFIILSLLATTIHFSAIFVFFIFIIFYKLKIFRNKYVVLLLYFLSLIFLLEQNLAFSITNNLFSTVSSILKFDIFLKYFSYLNSEKEINWLKYAIYNILGLFHIIFIFLIKRFNYYDTFYKGIILSVIYGVILINFFSFSPPMTRIAFYFQIYQIIIIPYMINKIKPKYFIRIFDFLFSSINLWT
ncbi:MAG: hypothetical protein PWP68_526 [Rikenellaceae bacterium]|nr:hypothetical protein [Rikenellaceae bacterium]